MKDIELDFNDNILKEIKANARRNIKAANLVAKAQIKAIVPVDTGHLRDHIADEVLESENEIRGIVGTPTDYGPDVEFGTKHTRAQPFIRPGFRAVKEDIITLLSRK